MAEKSGEYAKGAGEFDVYDQSPTRDPDPEQHHLHRGLKSRHITMIAIGGAIGTGLIIGTGSALAKAGPASILISYSLVGVLVWIVMCAVGEMGAWLPLEGGFTAFADRYCDSALGFALGWTYWFKYIIVTPNQLTAGALVIQFWVKPERVNPGVFIAIFMVLIACINYFGIRVFGEFEFYLSSFKVIVVIGLILLSFILALGGGPNHDRIGFRYYHDPGAFKPYLKTGSAGNFLGFWSSMVTAVFAYLGTELVGVTLGEAQNPRKTIPRAIKLTFYRIVFFYVLSVLFLGMIVPYDSPDLVFATKVTNNSASASPFVVAIKLAGIPVLPHILNACILIFVFSAANSDLYIGSRTIYGLAKEGKAPRIFAWTDKRGVPVFSLLICILISSLAFMNVSSDSRNVFLYFVNVVSILGLLTWISILVAHIGFIRARKAQNVPVESLAFKSPFGLWGSSIALFFCCLIALTKNFNVFVHDEKYGNLDVPNFITGYIGIPVYLTLIAGYKLVYRNKAIDPKTADLWTGREEYERETNYWLELEREKKESTKPQSTFYKRFVSWLL
ncbi:amino acid permease Dip5 [Eremomyces bilateralis CBS 781.70]|uniref:Amino acid permease Dip5 n=1 Tax=Eremomyces bilateralis CBS 781.70 TaxID=1392243 RepID=A0A6G1GF45_9PEZI|nr:amino acid permease Dip5 [Eremomyces bilateralis CBS 781.70]KAF1816735.1 amino acid permease Dip5 [Eremomyces bilateralis CBS 781.70]